MVRQLLVTAGFKWQHEWSGRYIAWMESSRLRSRSAALVIGLSAAMFTALVATSTLSYVDVPSGPEAVAHNPINSALRQPGVTPFYTPPSPLPVELPGTILKSEPIADPPPGIKATRIMYLSTKANGEPIAVTGMIAELDGPAPEFGRPVVGFAHGTVGTARQCAPSIAPFDDYTTGTHMWEARIRPLVNQGYVVAATDYEGEGAPGDPTYILASTEGYNVLDSLRAAVYLEPNRINASQMALYGHSQGGQATLAAASMAPEYAPELQLRGAVASAPGMIPPIPLALDALVSNPGTAKESAIRMSYILSIVESWTAAFPGEMQPDYLLTPEGIAALPLVKQYCNDALIEQLDKPFATYVKADPSKALLNVIAKNVPVEKRITIPILMLQGLKDTDVSPALTIASTHVLCQLGTVIESYTVPEDTHETLVWTGRPKELSWIADRFAGESAPNTCGGQQ